MVPTSGCGRNEPYRGNREHRERAQRVTSGGSQQNYSKISCKLGPPRSKNDVISSLVTEEGLTITDPKDILSEERNFFSTLYSGSSGLSDLTDPEDLGLSQEDIPTLSDTSKARLEEGYSPDELRAALNALNKGKCPGTDGLTPEFYSHFWGTISQPFCESLSYSLTNGLMSVGQRRGVISLIPKKGADRRFVRNWRPIILLNTDYKSLQRRSPSEYRNKSRRLSTQTKMVLSPEDLLDTTSEPFKT